jgi:hypothetical protein
LSFAKWQTGKEAMPTPTKTVVNRRPWTVDFRDRTKEQVVIRKGEIDRTEGPREMGWPDEPGFGKYSREFLNGNVGE